MAKNGGVVKNTMALVICPNAGNATVWANSKQGGFRCTKCGQDHTPVKTK